MQLWHSQVWCFSRKTIPIFSHARAHKKKSDFRIKSSRVFNKNLSHVGHNCEWVRVHYHHSASTTGELKNEVGGIKFDA